MDPDWKPEHPELISDPLQKMKDFIHASFGVANLFEQVPEPDPKGMNITFYKITISDRVVMDFLILARTIHLTQ